MAHPPHVKAQALAMLILGDRVTYVAKVTGVPKQTVIRWKPEVDAFLLELLQGTPSCRPSARRSGRSCQVSGAVAPS